MITIGDHILDDAPMETAPHNIRVKVIQRIGRCENVWGHTSFEAAKAIMTLAIRTK